MRLSPVAFTPQPQEGEKRVLNSELWHACAGPLVSLPAVGSRVVYFPQGHSEQVAASTNNEVDARIPHYPSLPPQLICQLHNVNMHADVESDEVYAQMTLQPLGLQEQKDPLLPLELCTPSRQPTNYFCKTLTASDTSTHGGFSVPRRAAEKVFPPLDYTQLPPAQELTARDLHDNEWKFRHIFRGQPKRHLLTTGWSVFVSAKRLVAGDSVLFIWNDKNQLLLGIRRANRPQTVMPSSVLSSDSMHLGLLAAAAHAASTNSRFTIFYNPRASPSEFVIPLAKYVKALYRTRVPIGMRFRMLFETEESSIRRYMGTITGISDLDPVRWPNSHWRSVKVGWDESTAGERQPRVSLWEIEPVTTFPMYPSPFPLRLKRPWPPGFFPFHGISNDNLFLNSSHFWLRGDGDRGIPELNFQNHGVSPWMQQRADVSTLGMQNDMYQVMTAPAVQDLGAIDPSKASAPDFLQFQQPQDDCPTGSSTAMQSQMSQHILPQRTFLRGIQENQQPQSHPPTHLHSIQSQLQRQDLLHNHNHSRLPVVDQQNVMGSASALLLFGSTSLSRATESVCHQPSFSHSSSSNLLTDSSSTMVSPVYSLWSSFSQNGSAQLPNLLSDPSTSTCELPSKRAAVEQTHPSGHRPVVLPVEQLGLPETHASDNSVLLPPLPGREYSIDQEGNDDQSRHLLGVNIESTTLLMQNGIGSEPTEVPFASSNYTSSVGKTDFSSEPSMPPSSNINESRYLESQENFGQANTQSGNYVKVYKSGTIGRSLDISKFSSYQELRTEVARMFGLEGQLADPQRSGWQLVFVDRENDPLFADDPSPVWCLKILSPQEVEQLGK